MMNIFNIKFLSIFVLLFLLGLFPISVNSANDQDSAKQALEQLRMLQKHLSTKSSKDSSEKTTFKKSKSNKSSAQTKESAVARRARTAAAASKKNSGGSSSDESDGSSSESETIDDIAFAGVEEHLFPLNPERIVKLREKFNENELAKTQSAGTPPKPTATSQFVNLSPGSTPPVIRLSQGFVSSLVFLDSTGAPWPISAYDLGDPSAFNIQWDKISNTMMIQSNKLYTYGNLAVRLQGLNTPVMLTLIPGQKAVDYRVDLRIQGYGPNAKNMPMEEGLPPSASDVLLHVLDGVPPGGSTRLVVSGGDARAWLLQGKMFVRTNLTILSPGWIGSMTSADGMHAYEMQKSPVLLVSWHGKVMQLKVEGL
jgi:intracellular multiplication protein IcmK